MLCLFEKLYPVLQSSTNTTKQEDPSVKAGVKVAIVRMNGRKFSPVRMNVRSHIIFCQVDHFSSRWIAPIESCGSVIIEITRIEHFWVSTLCNQLAETGRTLGQNILSNQNLILYFYATTLQRFPTIYGDSISSGGEKSHLNR